MLMKYLSLIFTISDILKDEVESDIKRYSILSLSVSDDVKEMNPMLAVPLLAEVAAYAATNDEEKLQDFCEFTLKHFLSDEEIAHMREIVDHGRKLREMAAEIINSGGINIDLTVNE